MSAAGIDVVGYGAAVLTTAAFAPQVWHTWRTRDVSGISLAMYLVFTLGIALWLLYGWLRGAWPIVAANAVTLALAAAIVAMKLRWGGLSRPSPARRAGR
jgi:MtN3 and saliva related transmembrane protein